MRSYLWFSAIALLPLVSAAAAAATATTTTATTTSTTTTANITLLPLSTGAASLDGSPYGFYFVPYHSEPAVPAQSTHWTISIQGGGWCVGIDDCYGRSQMRTLHGEPGSYGSSIPYAGQEHGCGCMNTDAVDVTSSACNCLMMLYLDGGSFSGNVAEPVPVPSQPGKTVHYRGLHNLDATLDYAFEHLGLGAATELVVTGSSAGGLSTFLHADRIAARLRGGAPNCTLVTAAPVVGYFLDHANFADEPAVQRTQQQPEEAANNLHYPHTGNYSEWMRTVYTDMNVSAALLPACLAAFPAAQAHLCFMSPHMARFVQTPFFLFNSKVDAWQMDNDLQIPCRAGDANHTTCDAKEQAAIVQYGGDFVDALAPVIGSAPKNGAFVTSCICHSCSWHTLTTGAAGDETTSYGYYAQWLDAQRHTTKTKGAAAASIHIDTRGPNGGGDLKDPLCMAFP